jgi:hypothetical protein
MQIQGCTPASFSNSSQQRQAFAASLADKATMSDRLAEEPKGNSSYDFTTIAPNDNHIMTQASFMPGKRFQSTH